MANTSGNLLQQSNLLDSVTTYIERLTADGGLWRVAVEMLLIGVVVYVALRFLRGTRGARLLKSFGLILITSFVVVRVVAEKLELDRLVFIYPYFVAIVVLTTLVAFQPEVRRGLIRLGDARWLRRWSKETETFVEPVVAAVSRLSQKKIGALIAIQRDVGLDALLESGVRLDAETDASLLETIFWPGSPLHDMGVIIRHGRIAAAACQFPIAESHDVVLSLGSRHRAALGLSQESDATVVVVSEETGGVSVAENGTLQQRLTSDTLRNILLKGASPIVETPAAPESSKPPAKISPQPPSTEDLADIAPTPVTQKAEA